MLTLNNITASYKKEKNALENITFRVKKNRIHALIGKNGSGKSTLIKCIGGTLPYSGDIILSGHNLSDLSYKEKAQRIAILPQNLPRIPLTVQEVAQMGRSPYTGLSGILSDTDHSIVEDAIHKAGAAKIRHKRINEISGGERQQAYLALVLAQNTDIIVFDEPTTHMDIKHESELLKLLKELTAVENKTILTVMHNISLAAKYADEITVIDKGIQIFTGTKDECLTEKIIEKNFEVSRKTTTDGEIFFMAD